jgi:hypothetical protein
MILSGGKMYSGKIAVDTFSLFHDKACVVVQTISDYGSLERIRKRLALTLTYAFFVEQDGDYLAELKANKLWKCVKNQLPKDLNFEISDAVLAEIIEQTIARNAAQWFGDYCQLSVGIDKSRYVSVVYAESFDNQ